MRALIFYHEITFSDCYKRRLSSFALTGDTRGFNDCLNISDKSFSRIVMILVARSAVAYLLLDANAFFQTPMPTKVFEHQTPSANALS